MTLNALIQLLEGLTPENLFPYLANFFSQQEIKEKMVELNQLQLYENQVLRDGTPTPEYADYTIEKRKLYGWAITPKPNYHYHETGDLFRAMGVQVGTDFVAIVCSTDNPDALGLDFGGGNDDMPLETSPSHNDAGHIEDMFELYDYNREGLGLTEENFAIFMDGMKEAVVKGIKEIITGGDLPF